jgi:hypothetical protein
MLAEIRLRRGLEFRQGWRMQMLPHPRTNISILRLMGKLGKPVVECSRLILQTWERPIHPVPQWSLRFTVASMTSTLGRRLRKPTTTRFSPGWWMQKRQAIQFLFSLLQVGSMKERQEVGTAIRSMDSSREARLRTATQLSTWALTLQSAAMAATLTRHTFKAIISIPQQQGRLSLPDI